MSYFHYQQDELFCEQVNLKNIVHEYGTPCYIYSQTGLIHNFKQIDAAFANYPHTINFALKANSNLTLLKLLARQGCGADVVSGGELFLARQAGFPPEKIVFAGVGKTDSELRLAIENDIAAINVESEEELTTIAQLAQGMDKKANVALRVNPDVDVHGHPFISTGAALNKFGIDWQIAPQLYLKARQTMPFINLVGIHCHIGSMIFDMDFYQAAASKLKTIVDQLQAAGIQLQHVDIGGGLGVNYEQPLDFMRDGVQQHEKPSPQPQTLVERILPIFAPLNCAIFFEPGRSIVANTSALLTQVQFVKETRGKRFISVDTGMHHLIRPALYGAYHEIVSFQATPGPWTPADVVGPICESADFLAQGRAMPTVKRGDLLAVMTTGAYGYSLASNYNSQLLPAEVLVKGQQFNVIRHRQKYPDLLRLMA